MVKPVPLTTLVAGMLALALLAFPANVIAGPVETFTKRVKVQRAAIRKTINTAIKQRAKDKYQKAASDRYTRNYNAVYKATGKYVGSDTSKLRYTQGKHPSKSTVSRYIETFDTRISKLKKLQRLIKKDIRKMDQDKSKWWNANGKYFDGKPLSAAKLRKLAYWVRIYGTEKGNVFGIKYHTKVALKPGGSPKQYKGGITPEKAYLKKLSGNIGGLIRVYKAAKAEMERRLAQLKKGKKKPSAAPPLVPHLSEM